MLLFRNFSISFVMFIPVFVMSQEYAGSKLIGLYTGSSGGVPTGWYENMEVTGIPPSHFYNLQLRQRRRFVLIEKYFQGNDTIASWVRTIKGSWKVKGDTLQLKYCTREKTVESYFIQVQYEVKIGDKIERKILLESKKLYLTRVWKGDGLP